MHGNRLFRTWNSTFVIYSSRDQMLRLLKVLIHQEHLNLFRLERDLRISLSHWKSFNLYYKLPNSEFNDQNWVNPIASALIYTTNPDLGSYLLFVDFRCEVLFSWPYCPSERHSHINWYIIRSADVMHAIKVHQIIRWHLYSRKWREVEISN